MIWLILLLFPLLWVLPAHGNEAARVNMILDKWTSSHWGEGCFVWILHYPEEIVLPWTELQLKERAADNEQKNKYRRSFRKQLLMDEAEAFLLSIAPFGGSAFDLAPLSDKITLVTPGGEEVAPLSYDEIFDKNLSQMTQGLVFFPLQKEEAFSVRLKGLGLGSEGLFSFPSLVVRNIERDLPVTREKVLVITPGNEPQLSSGDKGSSDLEEDVELHEEIPEAVPESVDPGEGMTDAGSETVFMDRDRLVRSFLDSWIKGDYDNMYLHLSDNSRQGISRAVFTRDMMQSTFRVVIMEGYSIKWVEKYKAQISGNADMVIMSQFKTKMLNVVEEEDGWKISW